MGLNLMQLDREKLKKRVTGIEPVSFAWKAKVLPLNHTRKKLRFSHSNTIIRNLGKLFLAFLCQKKRIPCEPVVMMELGIFPL